MRTLLFTAFAAMTVSLAAHGAAGSPPNNQTRPAAAVAKQPMTAQKILIMVNGRAVIATLADNPIARDFHSLLPLTLTLNDYAATEKVAYLARKLSGDGAPAGAEPATGDIAYYAPWGNLAIYYKDFAYSDGLIKLGTIDAGIDAFRVPGSLEVTIEAISEQRR
jgi:hypothetical protein